GGDAGRASPVAHGEAVKAALLDPPHARLEKPADGLPALGAQLTVLGGGAAAEGRSGGLFPRRPPGPARRGVDGAAACLVVHSESVAVYVPTAVHSVHAASLLPFPR